MILILAGRRDRGAYVLAERWSGVAAAVITCRDVCRPGWQASDRETETLCVDGRVFQATEVQGVLGRLAYVAADELVHINPDDRPYAASELAAFLLAWLAALDVPMLNRPTATCLSGPGWRPEQWAHAAAELGITVSPTRRRVPGEEPASAAGSTIVTVVGEHCIGARDEAMATAARALARRAGTALVDLGFAAGASAPTFTGASIWPDVLRPDVNELALTTLTAGHAGPRP